jgi:O-antigen/teichoic acid export membrane protein
MQHEPVRMIRFFRKVLVLGVLAIAPIMIGMMAASREMVEVLLGEKWLPCVPYIVPACLIGLAFPIQYLNLNVLLASGRSGLVLKLEVVKKIFVALFLAVTVSQGIMALVWGQAAAALIALILNSISVGKVFGYGVFKQARDLAGPLTVCVIMGASVFFVSRLEVALLLKLALQIITGGAGYLVLLYALFLIAPRSVCGEVIHAGLKSAGSRLRGIAERR